MSTTSVVPSQVGNSFSQKKKTMKLFYHLLSDMRHQRVAVIALALGQTVNIYSFFIDFSLWSIISGHFKKMSETICFYRFSIVQR